MSERPPGHGRSPSGPWAKPIGVRRMQEQEREKPLCYVDSFPSAYFLLAILGLTVYRQGASNTILVLSSFCS